MTIDILQRISMKNSIRMKRAKKLKEILYTAEAPMHSRFLYDDIFTLLSC